MKRPVYAEILDDAVWYVGNDDGETADYFMHGAKHCSVGGNLVASRNRALRDAFESGCDCVMLDDDLKNIKLPDGNEISLVDAIEMLQNALYKDTRGMFYVAGIPPTTNTFYYHAEKPLSFTNYLITAMLYVRNGCELYFDPQFETKEDYDYTLQHIQKFKGAVRVNGLLANFQHWSNKGGVVDWRNDDIEAESVRKLKSKWGPHVRDNPRRKNEILLRV